MLRSLKMAIATALLSTGFMMTEIQAETFVIDSFYDFCYGNITSAIGSSDDMGFTVDGKMPSDSNYKFGFSINGGEEFVGYGWNIVYPGDNWSYCAGYFLEGLSDGQKPTGLYVVHDANGDGIGTYDTDTWLLTLGADDTMYTAGDTMGFSGEKIYIAGVEGNVDAFPTWYSGQDYLLPKINLGTVPEPATLALMAIGGTYLAARRSNARKRA